MSSPPDIAAAMQQLHSQMQQMQQQHQAQIEALMQQMHLPQPIAQAASPVAASDKPRLLAPPAYDGRSAGGVDLWLRELRKQFAWYGITMQGDADRIRFAAAHLTAVALDCGSRSNRTRPRRGDSLKSRSKRASILPTAPTPLAPLWMDSISSPSSWCTSTPLSSAACFLPSRGWRKEIACFVTSRGCSPGSLGWFASKPRRRWPTPSRSLLGWTASTHPPR